MIGVAVASAGPNPSHLHILLQADNHAITLSFNFYRMDALSDTQPTVLQHWKMDIDMKVH